MPLPPPPPFPFGEPFSGECTWRKELSAISEPLQLLCTDSGVGQPSGELDGSGFVTAAAEAAGAAT